MILRRLEGSRSIVVRAWAGRTVVVIGCGPSLTLGDVEVVRRAHAAGMVQCVVVNDAFLWAPWADVQHASDAKWHRWMTVGVAKPRLGLTAEDVRRLWQEFQGERCSIEWTGNAIDDPRVHLLRSVDPDVHGFGLSTDSGKVATGRNSGAQAVNIAVLAGATRILLLGFDGQPVEGQTHFHGGHATATPGGVWAYVKQSFAAIAKALPTGVEIVNCTPGSSIEAFPRRSLGEALEKAYA